MNKDYLGDSVYAEIEDGMIKLTTENGFGDSNTIYLEPEVMEALLRYHERHGGSLGILTRQSNPE